MTTSKYVPADPKLMHKWEFPPGKPTRCAACWIEYVTLINQGLSGLAPCPRAGLVAAQAKDPCLHAIVLKTPDGRRTCQMCGEELTSDMQLDFDFAQPLDPPKPQGTICENCARDWCEYLDGRYDRILNQWCKTCTEKGGRK